MRNLITPLALAAIALVAAPSSSRAQASRDSVPETRESAVVRIQNRNSCSAMVRITQGGTQLATTRVEAMGTGKATIVLRNNDLLAIVVQQHCGDSQPYTLTTHALPHHDARLTLESDRRLTSMFFTPTS